MAYLSWPDHGVPESSIEFVEFVEAVRFRRKGCMEPTIVHCSAGIGMTYKGQNSLFYVTLNTYFDNHFHFFRSNWRSDTHGDCPLSN